MKKILTFCAAVLASVSMWAATVDDLKVISANYNVYFEDVVTSNVSAGTLITDYVLSQIANTYKTNQGTDKTVEKLYCLRVKGTSQDVLAFKVSSSCTLVLYANRATDRTPYLDTKVAAQGESSITGTPTATDGTKGYVTYSIPAAGTYYIIGNGSDCYLAGLEFSDFCTDPEAHLAFTKSTAYVGEQFGYNYGSKSGGDLSDSYTLNGVPAVKGTDYTFTSGNITVLKAGQFVMHMITAAREGYCAADLSDTILIYEATPVASVTVDGPTAAYVGEAVTFTATAANASDYAWTVNGVDANTNAAEFTYTPAAAGEYSIVCSARNKFNAANEWIASEAKVLTASNVSGEIIKVELTSGTAATVTGILGGTADANLSSSKKMDKGKYFGFTLAKGAFAEGDTVVINLSAYGSNYPCLFADKNKETLLYLATETSTDLEYRIVLPAAANGLTSLYFARDANDEVYKWNPTFTSVSVIRPKAVKSTTEEFKGATINGNALNVSDFIELEGNQRVNVLETSYVEAPVVVFTKTVTTTYEDDSKTTKDVEVEVTAFNPTDTEKWQARTTINGVDYVVSCSKTASVVVTYMDGETVLGTENVVANGNPAKYEQYQSKSLASFAGWYNNADLADEHAVADMSAEVISKATTYYAKFENKYAESVNIEKAVMENSKGYDIIAQLGTLGYASNYNNEGMDISNDSLDTYEKKGAMRNYAYLGLKIKSKSLLNFRVAQGQTVLIKFGNVATTPQVSINGGEYAAMTITEGVYSYTATGDDLLSMYVSEDKKAVVLKQIMIGEAPALEDVVYDITCAETTNGTLACNWAIALPGEEVKLTVTPAEGYKVAAVTVNGEAITAVEGAYSFIMPAVAAAVSATFVEDTASALGNTEAEAKAVKVVRDGQLLILKNGVLYNAQGAIVK